jgi:hypothetical protein
MREFGCIAYAMVEDEKRGKLDVKGTKCLFLGYCEGTKAYRLMCVCNPKRSSSVGMLSSWRIALVFAMIWRCVQVGEMRPLMW